VSGFCFLRPMKACFHKGEKNKNRDLRQQSTGYWVVQGTQNGISEATPSSPTTTGWLLEEFRSLFHLYQLQYSFNIF
jgi:hypothetical protein